MTNLTSIYKLRVFTLNDIIKKLGLSHSAAVASLSRWKSQGVIKMVRRNMYVAVDMATDAPIADKYELATKVSSLSYVGWHSALEFHGLAHQPFYNVYVGSQSRFSDFSFGGIKYKYCATSFDVSEESGVITPMGNPYVRVTDLERTIVDCCEHIDRAGGVEELLHCIEGVSLLNESKLAKYLAKYGKTILYQKTGFILEQVNSHNIVSNGFIELCRSKGAVHTQHLTNSGDSDFFVNSWKLYVPKQCLFINKLDYELI